ARGRRLRRSGAADLGATQGVLAERQAALRVDVVFELRRRAEARAHRPGEEEAAQEAAGYDAGPNDSLSHSGVRVGRSVLASTVPWPVQPSASTVPSRSTM